jgi:hypothetical protein
MNKSIFDRAALMLAGIILLSGPAAVQAEVNLLGVATFPGDATDLSDSSAELEVGTPANRLGGISGIEYTGTDDRYLLIPDRGPADGATSYRCRFHVMRLPVRPGAAKPVTASLVSTTFLRNELGEHLVGATSAFAADDPSKGLRFDPESIRRVDGRLFISDEYGPFLAEFTKAGARKQMLPVPSRFQISHPAADPDEENRNNAEGRQANAGMEGMAVTPDGRRLVGIMQRPLIQDSAPGKAGGKRRGRNNRILKLDLADGKTHEYVYVLEAPSYGVSEILAINNHEFLVLERDGKGGEEARCKQIYKIDLQQASDVSHCDALPADALPRDIRPVKKSLFVDLLDPTYGIQGAACPEKFEGLAFGPDLPDGRRLLVVACDSDFNTERSTMFYAFAVDRDDLSGFGWSGAASDSASK